MSESRGPSATSSATSCAIKRIGVLSFHSSKETRAILNAVRALGHDPVWLRQSNTRTWTADGRVHFDPAVDVVVNRLLTTKSESPMDDLGVAGSFAAARPVLNPPEAVFQCVHKFRAAAILAEAGLPVPDAYMAFSLAPLNNDRPIPGTTVHKPTIGTNGVLMERIEADDLATPTIGRRRAFLQEFIDSETDRPFDVRVYVVDGVTVAAMKRYAPPDEWRTNVALGADVEGVTDELPASATALAERASEVFGLDYAGVDLIQHAGTWYVLEVNATAGFRGLFEATGVNPAAHIARLAIDRADGPVDADRIADLAATFDDSTPTEAAPVEDEPGRLETIGYTERVDVSGGRRVESALAKADTGAKRTSVDLELAARIGAGPVVGTTRVRSGTRRGGKPRPLVELHVRIGHEWHAATASMEDRSHMRSPVLLGRDVLSGYRVDVDRRAEE